MGVVFAGSITSVSANTLDQNELFCDTPSCRSIFTITSPETIELMGYECETYPAVLGGGTVDASRFLLKAIVGETTYFSNVTCENGSDALRTGVTRENESIGKLFRDTQAVLLEQRPASGTEYIDQQVYALTNFGEVNAQSDPAPYFPGTGFSLLQPIQSFWGWAVNVVYGIMIFVIIGVAFGVMFRARLPDGAAITIQTAIPNIALAMILIPLSYAITGLFIDAVTLGTDITRNFIVGPGAPGRAAYTEKFQTGDEDDRGLYADDPRLSILSAQNNVDVSEETEGSVREATSAAGNIIGFPEDNAVVGVIGGLFNIVDGGESGSNVSPFSWIGDILNIMIRIFLFFVSLRILIRLLKKFLIFIVAPIYSPFVFAAVAIPGNGTKTIMDYFKLLGSATLFYIVTYAMILLATVLATEEFTQSLPDLEAGLYVPPLIGFNGTASSASDGFISVLNEMLFAVLALTIYISIPKILDDIDEALGTTSPLPKFFTDAWGSAKDTVNFARSTGGAAASTAASIGRNATFREGSLARKAAAVSGTAIRTPGNLVYGANRTRIAARQGLRNFDDRLRGIKPGEAGSQLAKRRADTQERRDMAEARRLSAKNAVERNFWAKQVKAAENELTAINRSAGADEFKEGESTKKGELKIEVKWNGTPLNGNSFILDQGWVKEIDALVTGGTNTLTVKGFSLEVSAEGFKFGSNPLENFSIYSVNNRNSGTSVGTPDPAGDRWRQGRGPGLFRRGETESYPKIKDNAIEGRDTTPSINLPGTGRSLPITGSKGNRLQPNQGLTIFNEFTYAGAGILAPVTATFEKNIAMPKPGGTTWAASFDLTFPNLLALRAGLSPSVTIQSEESIISYDFPTNEYKVESPAFRMRVRATFPFGV